MAIRRISLLASLLALLIVAPASAQLPLPDSRTHVDGTQIDAIQAGADPEAPKLTHLQPDTNINEIRRGYLYVLASCDARCVVDVTAFTKIAGKSREIATARKTLPANKVRRIRLKIRSDVKRRIAAGARFSFEALPLPISGL
jgi:hypothetical protein